MQAGNITLTLDAEADGTRIVLTREYDTFADRFAQDVEHMLRAGAAELLDQFQLLPNVK